MIAPFSFLDVYVYHFVRMFVAALHAISLACVYARTTPAHPLFWAWSLAPFYCINNLMVVVSVASVASVALGRTWMGRRKHWTKGCVDDGWRCEGWRLPTWWWWNRVGLGWIWVICDRSKTLKNSRPGLPNRRGKQVVKRGGMSPIAISIFSGPKCL